LVLIAGDFPRHTVRLVAANWPRIVIFWTRFNSAEAS